MTNNSAQSLFGAHAPLTVAAHTTPHASESKKKGAGAGAGAAGGRWVERPAVRSPLAGAVDEAATVAEVAIRVRVRVGRSVKL